MSGADMIFRLFAQDVDASKNIDKVGDSADHTADKLDELGAKDTKVKVGADTGDAEQGLKDVGDAADDAGKKADTSGDSFMQAHGKLVAIAGAVSTLGPALAAIGPVMAGAGAAVGAMGLAFGGVISALHDFSAAQAGAGQSGAQMAATEFSNAVAVRNAQQSITDARTQAAIAAQNSADSIASAEQKLQNAEQSEQVAQQNLTMARQQASLQLIQLNEQAATSALDVQGAQLAVQQAQSNLNQAQNSGTSTALQLAQAQYAVQQAQNNLLDVQERAKEAAAAANTANTQGVNGMPSVVAAQRSYQQSVQGVSDAQKALLVAQRQAAQQQAASAEQVQKAVQALADLKTQQQLAAAATAAAGGGMNQFATDMAKLTPAGRAFVDQVLHMKGGLDQLKADAQTAVLPGFTTMLQQSTPLMPIFGGAITQVGHALGGMALGFGQLFASPAFTGALKQVFGEGAGLIGQITSALAPFASTLVQVGVAAAPIVSALGSGLHSVITGLGQGLAGLTVNAHGAGQGISAILGAVGQLLGPVGTLIGAVAGALGPALAALLPAITPLADALLGGLMPIINALAPILALIAQLITGVLNAIDPLLPVIGRLVGSFISALLPAFASIVPVLIQVARTLVPPLIAIMNSLSPVLGIVALAVDQIFQALLPVLPQWAQLETQFMALLPPLMPLIAAVLKLAGYLAVDLAKGIAVVARGLLDIVAPIIGAMNWIEGLFGKVGELGSTFSQVFGGLGNFVGNALNGLIGIVKGPINAVIGLVDTAISYLDQIQVSIPSWVPFVGGQSFGISIPQIPMLAAGGIATMAGLALVGERGPELLHLPTGAAVSPLPPGGLGGGFGTPDNPLYAQIDLRLDGQRIDTVLVAFQTRGGRLQSVRTEMRKAGVTAT